MVALREEVTFIKIPARASKIDHCFRSTASRMFLNKLASNASKTNLHVATCIKNFRLILRELY